MTDTEALRRALVLVDRCMVETDPVLLVRTSKQFVALGDVWDAAHRYLTLAEGDEAVLNRMGRAMYEVDRFAFTFVPDWDKESPEVRGEYIEMARVGLAAITEEKLMGADLPLREPGTVALEDITEEGE